MSSESESEPRAPRRRRGRWVVLAVVLAVAAVVSVIVVRWNRTSAHPVSVDEARRRVPSTTSSGSTEVPSTEGSVQPVQGVYRYSGSGTDSLDRPARDQAEGPDMPATVTVGADGCWTFRIDYNSNHWQTWDYCWRDGTLEETGGRTYQKWDFAVFVSETTSTFTCSSSITIKADQQPSDTWQQSCSGSNGPGEPVATSEGPYRFVGRERIDVGGVAVDAFHYHRERTMAGAQRGTERSEVWFSVRDGMPLRNERQISATTGSIVGDVTYTENADFHLVSIDPA